MQRIRERDGDTDRKVRVLDGGEPVEDAVLERLWLPDGRPGALWRGQVFPITEDGTIDIAGPFEPPEACRRWPERSPGPRWSLLEGVEEAVLLLDGDALGRDAALTALRSAGLAVTRVGPALDSELQADWALRLVAPRAGPPLRARIEAALGSFPAAAGLETSGERLRLRLLEDQVRRLLVEREQLRAELEEARRSERSPPRPDAREPDAESVRVSARIEELERDLARAREETASLQRQLKAGRAASGPAPGLSVERLHRRLRAELEAFFAALPRVELVGDSVLALLTDYRDRKPVYRVLGELQAGLELRRRFKPIRGQEGWLECHVGTGQDDSGRIYARRSGERWLVLVSTKETQKRDLERLATLGRATGFDR